MPGSDMHMVILPEMAWEGERVFRGMMDILRTIG